ncbi:Os03g0262150 [Oryza sativa Japonica Group]|uniref:Os03g0262150 protein n=1 Tax=Oryza sativa subsp. japonica TaxID=39947 RepID=A0A0P0VVP1_ORYSJ|nr:hypothetical protein EE612_016622 [Oryza sativa]BAS83367.1 Os03g0262150 [Oryza sativa Japonica Group]
MFKLTQKCDFLLKLKNALLCIAPLITQADLFDSKEDTFVADPLEDCPKRATSQEHPPVPRPDLPPKPPIRRDVEHGLGGCARRLVIVRRRQRRRAREFLGRLP